MLLERMRVFIIKKYGDVNLMLLFLKLVVRKIQIG